MRRIAVDVLASAAVLFAGSAHALTFHCTYTVEANRDSVSAPPAGAWKVTLIILPTGKAIFTGDAGIGDVELVSTGANVTFIRHKPLVAEVGSISPDGKSFMTAQSALFGPSAASGSLTLESGRFGPRSKSNHFILLVPAAAL